MTTPLAAERLQADDKVETAEEEWKPRLLTTAEVADRLGVSQLTIRRAVMDGQIEPVNPDSKPWRFIEDDLAEWQLRSRSPRWRKRHAEAVEKYNAGLAG